ncbi:hypothetical protein BD410DRAFT_809100 [Rickenella mellea]|uniref:Uncharacterized protein n=1 Tax=Rickenella mellea TaxID=50990 RepID=A0A4Y7PKY8_9AGAM|nr:hypothetical protein BD410DRAFT_809100 [Rickenella mellea]
MAKEGAQSSWTAEVMSRLLREMLAAPPQYVPIHGPMARHIFWSSEIPAEPVEAGEGNVGTLVNLEELEKSLTTVFSQDAVQRRTANAHSTLETRKRTLTAEFRRRMKILATTHASIDEVDRKLASIRNKRNLHSSTLRCLKRQLNRQLRVDEQEYTPYKDYSAPERRVQPGRSCRQKLAYDY